MLSGEEKVLAGLSGGPDSVCLLHVLALLKERLSLNLVSLYIDHNMRPNETQKEIEFCRKLSEYLDVLFISKAIDVKSYAREHKMNIQEAARQLRFRIFDETSQEIGADRIALGHTADDQAETVLMRIFRGSGPKGLAGIPPVRKNIIRPLIETERSEIEQYLYENKIDSVIDSSNTKKDYLRNRIRLSFIPMLREFNPGITETLSKTASIFRDEDRYFEVIVTKTLMKLISRKTDSRIELFLAPFEIMDKVIMRRVLRRAIDETRGLRGISFIHIEDITDLIKAGRPGDRLYLPGGIRAIKEYSTLLLTSEPPVKLSTYILEIPGQTVLKEAGVLIKASLTEPSLETSSAIEQANAVTLDADKLIFPLMARPRAKGDFFYPLGFGRRKKLQDFFVDLKMPREERDKIPLIISGNDIIWIAGCRGDERYKVTEVTTKVLKLELKKAMD
jgi:tRNA(Ile)-lysidine synthase